MKRESKRQVANSRWRVAGGEWRVAGGAHVSPLPPGEGQGVRAATCLLGCLLSFALLAAGNTAALAAAPPAKEKPSPDDELMRQLRAKPLDDVDRELFGPVDAKPGPKKPDAPGTGPGAKPVEDPQQKLRRELGAAAEPEEQDPLLSVFRQMREAEGLIGRNQSGSRTQQVQKQIVSELEGLIQEAKKNAGKCQGGNPASPQATAARQPATQPKPQPGPAGPGDKPSPKPAATSNAKPAPGEAKPPENGDLRTLVKDVWGLLPERERNQMLELPIEEFLPKYEPMIIEYFKRLSEEKGRGERPRMKDE